MSEHHDPAKDEPASTRREDPLRSSLTSRAWMATVALAVVLLLLIIFIAQNTQRVEVSFLGWDGTPPLAVALLIAVAVGLSRIYLGYHYLSDVVGGFAAGLAWLLIVVIAFQVVPRTWARRPWAKQRTRHAN